MNKKNKLEGFELSYKIYLAGKTCWYLSSARAWHSRGGGRNLYSFDFRQQEAYFWSRFGNAIKPDITDYLKMQMMVDPCLKHVHASVALPATGEPQ